MHVDSTNMDELSIDSHVDRTSDTLGDLQNHVLEKKRSSLEFENVSVMTSDLVVAASSYSPEDGGGLLPELQDLSLVEALEASISDTCLVSNETTPSALIDVSTLSYSTCYSNPLFEMDISELEVEKALIVGPSLSESKLSDNHQKKPFSEVDEGLDSSQLSVTRYVSGPTPYKSMLPHSKLTLRDPSGNTNIECVRIPSDGIVSNEQAIIVFPAFIVFVPELTCYMHFLFNSNTKRNYEDQQMTVNLKPLDFVIPENKNKSLYLILSCLLEGVDNFKLTTSMSTLSYVLRTFFVMFEYVLSSLKKEPYPYWRPHFAIKSLEAASVVCLGDLSDDGFYDFCVRFIVLLR
ncbi:hypothetical protein AXF42_Ash021304 [Apostasia shenzhenica]|uniref:Uncharacterized protein n=1 Tax=Apostasia shenzhenica TaxID=1088818 RepID=A0A2H9ZYH3_9ASPA|nr:hypothetical protein AXF42_Ash021304 [Apostasia shenzhenica]